MTLLEAMERRHSVRSYTDQPICGEVLASLEREVRACNIEGGLHIQLVTGEPEAFRGVLAHYGKFRNVKLSGPGLARWTIPGGAGGLLRGTAGPDRRHAGAGFLLGGADLPQGEVSIRRPPGRKAGLCHCAGLWRGPRRPP